MTVSTLRPNATTTNTGALTGGATAHAVLSDNSDASYVTLDQYEVTLVGLTDLTLPAGAVIKNVIHRVRSARVTTTCTLYSIAAVGTASLQATTNITWASPLTSTLLTSTSAYTDAEADAATLRYENRTNNALRVHESYLDVTYVAQPTLTVDAPTGTLTEDNTPTVSWTNTLDSDGGVQARAEVKVFTAAQYGIGGFDPATSPNTYSAVLTREGNTEDVTTVLPNATYRAYVRTAQSVGGVLHWSAWAYSQFIVNVSPPDPPTITATADNANARIALALTEDDSPVVTDWLEVERSLDQSTWTAVRVPDGIITTGTIYDYEAPNGVTVYYRARGINDTASAALASTWATANATWTDTNSWWLKHPTTPSLNVEVEVKSLQSYGRQARKGTFQAYGRDDAVVISDTRGPASGSLGFQLRTAAEQDDIDAIIADESPLLLQGPLAANWDDRWLALGDQDRSRLIDNASMIAVVDTFGWTEVERPDGDITAWP